MSNLSGSINKSPFSHVSSSHDISSSSQSQVKKTPDLSPVEKIPSSSQLPQISSSNVLDLNLQQSKTSHSIDSTPQEQILSKLDHLKGFLNSSDLGNLISQSIERAGGDTETPLPQGIFASSPEEYKRRVTDFMEIIPRKSDDLFYPEGKKSQGGSWQAEKDFDSLTKRVGEMPTTTLNDVIDRALALASGIVEPHLFTDGNGRAALFCLYFELANHGFKLTPKAFEMHAKLFGEERHNRNFPKIEAKELMVGLSKREVSVSSLRNHMSKVSIELQELESIRSEISTKKEKYTPYYVNPVPKKGSSRLARSNLFATESTYSIVSTQVKGQENLAKQELSRQLQSTFDAVYDELLRERIDGLGNKPNAIKEKRVLTKAFREYKDQLATNWLRDIESDLERIPSVEDIQGWIDFNWPD